MAVDTVVALRRKFVEDLVAVDTKVLRVALFTVGRVLSAPIKLLTLKMLSRVRGHRIGEMATGNPAEKRI